MRIETQRLIIRNLRKSDLESFYDYRSNPEVTKFQGFNVLTKSEAAAFIKQHSVLKFGIPQQWVQYAIEYKNTHQLIGDCAICFADDGHSAQIGITISPPFQNIGIAKETVHALLEFLFGLPDFHRVTGTADSENHSSISLLKSCGFKQEGHFIDSYFSHGKWHSEYQFAILRPDWELHLETLKKQQQTFEVYNRIASIYEAKFMELALYNETYDRFCDLLPMQNPRVLEIACGPGNITKYMLKKRPDFKVDATDAAPNMVKLASQNNPMANCFELDCRNLQRLNEKYDGVICGFLLPYLSDSDCEKLVCDVAKLLAGGGIFYLSTIEGDYSQSRYETNSNGSDPLFIYYHSAEVVSEILNKNGFLTQQLYRIAYPGSYSLHVVFIAIKQ